jgi:hypothetical protein
MRHDHKRHKWQIPQNFHVTASHFGGSELKNRIIGRKTLKSKGLLNQRPVQLAVEMLQK